MVHGLQKRYEISHINYPIYDFRENTGLSHEAILPAL
jgi:hypothetical protein